ncbi:hypothetical protein H257_07909 [Aphanomyces astaci]|uniref:Uncharacterized protein n=1 Tax=Aphanomyces astaci TaxID=112090 RepID=W4GH80_APHAT|nr:hypothetical protein H257_07909 [Aphanomyces astaci]ETV78323.1 hypothetical protein H257_07909 [Aphanomyces astaci]|eukprot:XP_009831904.1 hypothetical protein H257_07909 [Aphanomyces astaci]
MAFCETAQSAAVQRQIKSTGSSNHSPSRYVHGSVIFAVHLHRTSVAGRRVQTLVAPPAVQIWDNCLHPLQYLLLELDTRLIRLNASTPTTSAPKTTPRLRPLRCLPNKLK